MPLSMKGAKAWRSTEENTMSAFASVTRVLVAIAARKRLSFRLLGTCALVSCSALLLSCGPAGIGGGCSGGDQGGCRPGLYCHTSTPCRFVGVDSSGRRIEECTYI